MSIFSYAAQDLFTWLTDKEDILVLDVRNNKDFKRFKVESPYPFEMTNVSYYDFMEIEEESVAKIPKGSRIRIVCAKEGSAKYVAEILEKHGYDDVGYLAGGIKTWGNLLVPKLINPDEDFELYQFIRPGKASCSYGLISGKDMMLFDPSRNVDFYLQFAQEKGCSITKIFETHLQADYIAGSRDISKKTGAGFFANEGDFKGSKINYIKVVDGEIHSFSKNGPQVRVLFTPGHTPGSTSYIVNERFMISGDMVFIETIGRPDLGGKSEEWAGMLFESMLMVKKLDDQLIILPGHYIDWNEANDDLIFAQPFAAVKERNKNIYNIGKFDNFFTFIKDNMRQQPEEYGTIRLVNANLEQVDEDRREELDLGKNECAATAYAKAQAA
ncbi:MAG: MBL fold metallo-hydrolase [Desulfobulbaceae bacterium]|nr:MBL fold metallo-hydrolase [Desulfobulbaceae bacterium]